MGYMKRLLKEAATKLTTYLAALVVLIQQVADNAQDLLNSWPELMRLLPQSKTIDTAGHWATSVLGVLIVWSRVRRLIKQPPAEVATK